MKAFKISDNFYLVCHAGRRIALIAENPADAIVKFIERHLVLERWHRSLAST